jgi:hypothetical protein
LRVEKDERVENREEGKEKRFLESRSKKTMLGNREEGRE